ncbi:3-oxoadipate enol-lactonase [Ideonella sp. B508-1]|uniref:3-oxoadipate enol-lactonase n=1 Tax=Ideonella sp. B508-1 TaxID=137716 RepID=UPI00034C2322|nr:3-oxoadipate enol-lactonase [Ideonella sp. B508-1]
MSTLVEHIDTPDGRFRVALDGPARAPAVVLSNSLGTTLEMWDPVVPRLAEQRRVIRYDTRGHGSAPDGAGPCTLARLGQDVVHLLDALDIAQADFCGISMGGLTGLWLGVHAAPRIRRLVVANSAARIGTLQGWQDRAALARTQGLTTIATSSPSRWFTPGFLDAHPDRVQVLQQTLAGLSPQGYAACCDALAQADLREEIDRIACPVLLLAGRHDPVTTVGDAQFMAERIPGAELQALEASHLSSVEVPDAFLAALLPFLQQA